MRMNENIAPESIAPRTPRSRVFDYAIIVIVIIVAVVFSALAGKDLNWDQLNYHFYLPYSLFNDRVGVDYMPASGQSYLNPLAYAPFYWMVTHHWNSLLIASALAILHSLNIVLAYLILKRALPDTDAQARIAAVFGAALAFLSPIFLLELGTTFADITTSALVLGAVFYGLHSDRKTVWWKNKALLAGLCIGAASGLKLSNLLFGPGLGFLILVMQNSLRARIRTTALLAMGSIIGLTIAHGYWGWKVWQVFGNPFYPYFNNWFPNAAEFPPGANHERYLPDNLLDVLSLPFRMTLLKSWVYTEAVAPDLRFAALMLLAILSPGLLFAKRRSALSSFLTLKASALLALIIFFVVSYALWIGISGNGRYGLALTILCGPILVAATWRLVSSNKLAIFSLAVLTALQILHVRNGDMHLDTAEWSTSWYEVTVPERLRREPYLYINVGSNSNSYIYPFLAQGSVFTNPIGQISFDVKHPSGRKLKEFLSKHAGPTRAIAMTPHSRADERSLQWWIRSMDSMIARFNYAVDAGDCEMISAAGSPSEPSQDMIAADAKVRRFWTCRLVSRPFALAEERQQITNITADIVAWCPKLFKPAYTVVEHIPDGWLANFTATDTVLYFLGEQIVAKPAHSSIDLNLGTLQEWSAGKRPDCASFPDKPRKAYTF